MAPLQRPLIGRLAQILGSIMLLWLLVFTGLNDRRLGQLITWIVSHNLRGQFNLGYVHYDFWSGLASAILDIPVPVRGGDFEMIDPDGNLVIRLQEIRGKLYIGELVRGLLRTAVSAPFKRGSFVQLHFSSAELRGGYGRIQALGSSLRKDPLHPEMNIVATMSGRRPSPPGDQPGYLRVIVDGEGATLEDIDFEMRFPLWQLHLTGMAGAATLRFSTAASETRPGRPSFTYEVAPLTARGGELTITPSGLPGQLPAEALDPLEIQDLASLLDQPPLRDARGRIAAALRPPALADSYVSGPRISLPIREVVLRRFGARPSRMQDLSFRGRARLGGALLELDGRLLETYCDVGADIELSFEEAGALMSTVTGGALFGRPRGRGRVFGPFSEDLPRLATNQLHPCLGMVGRESPYGFSPPGSEARLLLIDGAVAQLEADLAKLHISEAQAPFRLVRNVLTLPTLSASALGGTVRSEGFRIDLNSPMHYSGLLRITGADPGQAMLVPAALRPLLNGAAEGSARVYGLIVDGKPETVAKLEHEVQAAAQATTTALRPDPVRPTALDVLDTRQARESREAMAALRRGELVRITGVQVDLDRQQRSDALPPELRLTGTQITYGLTQMGLRDLRVSGPGLDLVVPGGSVGVISGRLNLPGIRLTGGAQAARTLRALGAPVGLRDLSVGLNLTGSLDRPEVEQGFLQAHGLDLRPADTARPPESKTAGREAPRGAAVAGREAPRSAAVAGREAPRGAAVIEDLVTGFTVHDGALALQGLSARGLSGAVTGRASLQLYQGNIARRPSDPAISVNATAEHVDLGALLALAGAPVPAGGLLTAAVDLGGTLRHPTGTTSAQVPLLSLLGSSLSDVNLGLDLLPDRYDLNALYAVIGRGGVLRGSATVGRQGEMPLDLTLTPDHVQLHELPGADRLPVQLRGAISGGLRVTGAASPLRPVLQGELLLDEFSVTGRPRVRRPGDVTLLRAAPEARAGQGAGRQRAVPVQDGLPGPAFPLTEEADVDPLFRLLGVAVRTLTLGKAQLSFMPVPGPLQGGTQVHGTLFNALQVDGQVNLDAADPRGELSLRFGCPERDARLPCDLALEEVVPELKGLGPLEASARVSGELRVAFGRDVARLQGTDAAAPGLPYLATLRLWRALLTVKTADEEGVAQWYRLRNADEVIASTDGGTLLVQKGWFRTERVLARRGARAGAVVEDRNAQALGDLRVRGRLAQVDSALEVVGALRLELVEELLRGSFQQVRGDVRLDLRFTGPRDNLVVAGQADLSAASLKPYDLDAPFLLPAGRLSFTPGSVRVSGLQLSVDGATTNLDGTLRLSRALPPEIARYDLGLRGAASGLLLQWLMPKVFSEARGRVLLDNLRLRGTLKEPQLDGVVSVDELRMNLRRFHEVLLRRGTLRFAAGSGSGASLIFGCGPAASKQAGCQPIEGVVDGDGRLRMNGIVQHGGLGALMRPAWYDALQRVDLALNLDNVRHNGSGVYTIEVKTQGPLTLTGDGRQLFLSGNLDVVEGRYLQPFDLKEAILARRVTEEEDPFWKGDELLSRLQMDLRVSTNGLFRVLNNIADLRLSTKGFTISGPLESLAMKGTIRVDGGYFNVPGLRGEFNVKGDSKIDFDPGARWPDTPYVDVRGNNIQFDPNDQQRNVELALRGKVSELKIECLSSDGLNAADCASYLVLGGTTDQIRRQISGPTYNSSPQALAYSDRAIQLLSSQLLTSQIEDPLREKLRLDTVRIQFGVSSFDVQLCKRFGLYMRACGLAEWGLLAATSARYRAFGQFQFADWAVGELSIDRLERGFDRVIQDPINRIKIQIGARLPLLY